MMASGRVHDRAILDALERLDSGPIDTVVWRVTRKGRDPLRGSTAHGRWSAIGEIEVLYTSLEKEGAKAEVGYRISLEPVWPSRLEHQIHELSVKADNILCLPDMDQLEKLGVDIRRYSALDYNETQAIAAAVHFLEYDGLIIPSARYDCKNLILFTERIVATGQLQLIRTARP